MAWDAAKFRSAFPEFADDVIYPDAMLEVWHGMAACQVREIPNCSCMDLAILLCVAHIGHILSKAANGQNATGNITSSAIDKVSVGFSVPPFADGWGYWLGLSPYGQQLYAMLQSMGAGGFYFGGAPEGRAFRKVYGAF